MKNQNNIFFFEIKPIQDNLTIFNELKKQEIFFSYFQVAHKFYLLCYKSTTINMDQIEPFIDIIEELNKKKRKIRSFRGFFLYALEILEDDGKAEFLQTNFKPSFWRNLKDILHQNKKMLLLDFLFNSRETGLDDLQFNDMYIKNEIENLKTGFKLLQEKVNHLEIEITRYNSNVQYESRFITLKKLSEEDKTEIIQRGFQLHAEGKISLKDYYENIGMNTLFNFKKFSIKYEAIRKNKLYQKLNSQRQ